jgi:hypothetical protein
MARQRDEGVLAPSGKLLWFGKGGARYHDNYDNGGNRHCP